MKFKLMVILRVVIIFTISFINTSTYSQDYNYIWAKNSAVVPGTVTVIKTLTDNNGNIYSVGTFSSSSITFESYKIQNNNNNGTEDIFIVKHNSIGNVLWAIGFGGKDYDVVEDCSIDNQNNIYIIGSFDSKLLITGNTSLTPFFGSDVLLIKLDQNGKLLWSRNFGGDGDDYGSSCSILLNGNIVITGSFAGNKMFLNGELSKQKCSNGVTQFYAEIEGDADIVYAKVIQECIDISNGWRTIKCNSSPSSCKYYLLGNDEKKGIFINEYNCNGVQSLDIIKIVPSFDGFAYADQCVTDDQGNIFITGMFWCDTLKVYGKNSGSFIELNSLYGWDFYIAKLTSDFKLVWAKSYGSKGTDWISEAAVDGSGSLYLSGIFLGESIFEGPNKLQNNSSADKMFIARIDNNGIVNLTKSNISGNVGNPKLALDNYNNIYVGGNYFGDLTLGNIKLDYVDGFKSAYFISKLGNTTTSIKNIGSDTKILVNPNPNQGDFLINFLDDSRYNKIEIINLEGNILWSYKAKELDKQHAINISSIIQDGIYIIRLSNYDGNQLLHKLIVYH